MLMKEVESALFKTEMGINGRDPAGISRSITIQVNSKAEGLSSFLRNRGVTYVTSCGVLEHQPGSGHIISGFDSDLLFKGLRI
jgi:hypothetical protein